MAVPDYLVPVQSVIRACDMSPYVRDRHLELHVLKLRSTETKTPPAPRLRLINAVVRCMVLDTNTCTLKVIPIRDAAARNPAARHNMSQARSLRAHVACPRLGMAPGSKVVATVYANRMVAIGNTSFVNSVNNVTDFVRQLRACLGHNICPHNITTVNHVYVAYVLRPIDLADMAQYVRDRGGTLPFIVSGNPLIFPDIVLTLTLPYASATTLVFPSGRIIIAGVRNADHGSSIWDLVWILLMWPFFVAHPVSTTAAAADIATADTDEHLDQLVKQCIRMHQITGDPDDDDDGVVPEFVDDDDDDDDSLSDQSSGDGDDDEERV